MLNVNALQKTLSAMPLPQLQQYAALHKNDPYVVAMALSIANTKKEAMTAQQGMAGRQPMPKVVDQDIAAIAPQAAPQAGAPLPEDVGIGALPAPNMQHMADGGIVAFEEGGEVPRYQSGGRPEQNLGGVSSIPYYLPGPSAERNRLNAIPGQIVSGAIDTLGNWWDRFTEGTTIEQQRRAKAQAEAAALANQLKADTKSLGRSPSNAEIEQQYLGMGAQDSGQPTGPQPTGAQPSATAPGQTASQIPAAPAGAGGPNVNSVVAGIDKLLGPREKVPEQADIEKQLEERQKPYFDKLDKTLSAQREKLGSSREESIYMAMIKGGFAAAAGKSPYALANIAEGGKEGIADLADSFKELRKAAQEQSKMEMDLEKSRMEASTGNLKTAWDRQDKAQERAQKRDQLLASAYTSISDATIRANAQVQAAQISSTGELRGLEALGAAPEGSALRKGFELKQELLKRTSLAETWAKLAYPSGNMGQPNEAFLGRFPTPETYVREAMQQDRPSAGGAGGQPLIRSR